MLTCFQPNIANDPHHIKTTGRFALIGVSHIPQACGNIRVGSTFSAQHTGETELRAEVFLMGFINHFQRCFFLHHLLWFFSINFFLALSTPSLISIRFSFFFFYPAFPIPPSCPQTPSPFSLQLSASPCCSSPPPSLCITPFQPNGIIG